jgi:neutral amino acid transport system permease protein
MPRVIRADIRRFAGLLFLSFIVLLSVLVGVPAAHADEVGTDENPFRVSGNVQFNGEPVEGVRLEISGSGLDAEVETDAEGKFVFGVPEKSDYEVTLDESSLPEGIAVVEGSNVQEVTVGAGGRVATNFFIGEGERNVTSFFDQFVERIVSGLNFGLMLGLAAIGASLVFGTTGLSNFAHAEMVTFGAIIAWFLGVALGLPLWLAIILAVVVSALFGLGMDAGIWRPLRRKGLGTVQLMIVSIGLSLALRYVFQFFIGGGTLQLPGSSSAEIPLFGAVSLTVIDLVSMAISIVVIAGFAFWLLRTRTGKATRAISDNPSLAAASGIDVDRVVRIVWIMAAGMAGLAGVLYAYYRPGLKWDMGAGVLLLVFAAITLGGLGTAFGALVGSLIVGVLVEISSLWIPADLKYVGALVVLILILLVRPQGILGRRERIG